MADRALSTVHLRDARSQLEATFVPGAGMICCSLRHRGEELLAQNAGVEAYAERGKTMGIPLLYPWANRLAGFDYTVAGQTVAVRHDPSRIALDGGGLPIHGVIGGRQHWELVPAPGLEDPPSAEDPRAEGTHARSLAALLHWSESAAPDLFEVFPFTHDLRYEAHLADGHLRVTITVHACASDAVPVAFGLHPYLSPTGAARERYLVELPPLRRLELDAHQIPLGPGEELPAQQFELGEQQFDDGFDDVAQPACFSVQAGTRRIALELQEGYPCAQVYTPQGGQFICFEPMTAPANALRSGSGLHVLAPGERYRAMFALSVADAPASE
jgi:aldose 1-epimerase